jgi:hypothetical protein
MGKSATVRTLLLNFERNRRLQYPPPPATTQIDALTEQRVTQLAGDKNVLPSEYIRGIIEMVFHHKYQR